MTIAAVLVVLFVAVLILIALNRRLVIRRNDKLQPEVERRFDRLIMAASEWKGNYHDLVLTDIDRTDRSLTINRVLLLVTVPEEHWQIMLHPTKGIRLAGCFLQDDTRYGRPIRFYPDSGYSQEPWLMAKIDLLLAALADLKARQARQAP